MSQSAAGSAELGLHASGIGLARGARVLVRELALSVPRGGMLEVHGENGVGKTTLLRALVGLHPLRSGSLRWRGQALHPMHSTDLLYQGHNAPLDRALDAGENLAQLLALDGQAVSAETQAQALRAVGLSRVRSVPAWRLSAGQQRRVGLARMRLSTRCLWVLDEPITALDDAGVVLLMDTLAEHLRRGGACVASSHRALAPLLPGAAVRSMRLLPTGKVEQ